MGDTVKHVVLYDGECGFCSEAVQFILARDATGDFGFASLQGAQAKEMLARLGVTNVSMDTFYLVENVGTPRERLLERSSAALAVAAKLPSPWWVASAFRIVPRALRDAVYDVVARNRHRLPGQTHQCLLPTAEQRVRFLDR